ncbi:CBS domain-containing protein [Aliarcobacter thereius]|uniref:Inosine 5'-monophosphate dehydrogenase n=1 Tax=Aliarcobacter thereius LMG 24486 TaxID=1032240 RepID=A0A1C7WUX1_9BACT|nr:CBS domain-containing protein [Aliarcobacter thereius]OCL90929.1 inosine 5'-monophosphate dehydrogenase [Aliarcobacter thereius]OCL96242.1 inosine 5'-monophosphate dehydrogenase [Aliarcobacter thereius LMG 24486]QBF15793.1 CBS domain-containing protein [Aliarcobacter thereius LMG 24486]TLS94860.1 CBS domain-containing protein [Aliarcobacter thereius]HJE03247.1 CBS domain-containing protein [Aliarcobacter thereius]
MFAIYNNGTVGFRSTSDNLYDLKNIEQIEPIRFSPKEGFIHDYTEDQERKKQEFINSYRKMAEIDTLEPVYKIKDIMTEDVFHASLNTTVEDIYYFINDKRVSSIPITDFGKKIVGIIDKKVILNLIMKHIDDIESTLKKTMNDIYIPEVLTADPEADVRKVVQVMLDLRLDAVPIVDDNDILVGIVSKTDILKAVANLPKLQLWS